MRIPTCSHSWSFPRRWAEFKGKRNVDVQTCLKCGARRESPVQFGKVELATEVSAKPKQQFVEVTA